MHFDTSMPPARAGLTLALDTGSPVASLAIGHREGAVVERRIEGRAVSTELFSELNPLLRDVDALWSDVERIVVLRGPGSFTGLRIGFAAALGLHQASGPQLVGVPTLRTLASLVASAETGPRPVRVAALVDALRGEWFVEKFVLDGGSARSASPRSLGPPTRCAATSLLETRTPGERLFWVGFGAERLWETLGRPTHVVPREPVSLAAAALRLVAVEPDAAEPLLQGELGPEPLYLREAATNLPR